MHTVHLSAVTGNDGKIILTLPTGAAPGQSVEVEVRIEKKARTFKSKREWKAWVRSMAGSISDPTFERPLQPNLSDIEPLS